MHVIIPFHPSIIKFIPRIQSILLYLCFKKEKGRDSQNFSINPKIFFLGGTDCLRQGFIFEADRTSPRLAVLEAVQGARGVFD